MVIMMKVLEWLVKTKLSFPSPQYKGWQQRLSHLETVNYVTTPQAHTLASQRSPGKSRYLSLVPGDQTPERSIFKLHVRGSRSKSKPLTSSSVFKPLTLQLESRSSPQNSPPSPLFTTRWSSSTCCKIGSWSKTTEACNQTTTIMQNKTQCQVCKRLAGSLFPGLGKGLTLDLITISDAKGAVKNHFLCCGHFQHGEWWRQTKEWTAGWS